jgi:hypothetical protein
MRYLTWKPFSRPKTHNAQSIVIWWFATANLQSDPSARLPSCSEPRICLRLGRLGAAGVHVQLDLTGLFLNTFNGQIGRSRDDGIQLMFRLAGRGY